MKPIRCLLVDDENLALEVLQYYCNQINDIEVVGMCRNAQEATMVLQTTSVDVIFLDIQMPLISGLQWYKQLASPPAVIFCTAFSNFAVESYDVNAIDYLLKPISFERFQLAIEKLKKQIKQLENNFIVVRADRKDHKIPMNEILFIRGLSNYYEVITETKLIIGYGSLSELEEKLSKSGFVRVHRSYIVAKNKIESISSGTLYIKEHQVPIGRNYRTCVNELYNQA